ncbi:MAG TPA: LPS export ABC transporter periplasmic protein LptC [Candidatus Binatia bacterium]|nr:LPS export ABC transporter periplasmic protein LptC [Candidatus Binatia bacterium]
MLLAVFLVLGGVAYKVGESLWLNSVREVRRNPLKALDYLPESALHIRDFRRAKIEDGRKVWELFGDEANYFKDQKHAVVTKPRFYYFDKKGNTAETKGEVARLFFADKELEKMELQGGIEVKYDGYTLTSSEAVYLPATEQIVLPNRTVVVGEGLEVEGSRMEVRLEEKTVRMVQNVKSKFQPDKLEKPKNRSGANPESGR